MPELSGRGMSLRTALCLVAAIILGAAFILWVMGQPVFCRCGVIALWSGDIYSNQNSQQVADPYSFTHVTHGVLFFFALLPLAKRISVAWRLVLATLIEVSWEIAENTDFVINRYREATISLDYFGDSILNSSFDTLACVLGFALAARLPWRVTVGGIVAIEVILVLTIRDSLLLNIVMLLYPIEAIRQWQSAR